MRLFSALLLCITVLAGCAATGPRTATQEDVAGLTQALLALSPDVDATEAAQAAQWAFRQTQELAQAYEITDAPLVHNAKVNAGLKPRGLCYHWAEDMEAAFKAQSFETLDVTRAIANSENRLLIDHSTSVIIAKGAQMSEGIIIDPWRWGGRLFWSPVRADTRYDWIPRLDVLRKRGLVRYAHRSEGSQAAPPSDLTD